MNRWLALGWLLVIAAALIWRLPQLAERPMHNDEAINAAQIKGLWEKGEYRYDPEEYHGPSLYYLTLPFVWASGEPDFDHLSERTLRLVPVFFSTLLILLFWFLKDGWGRTATLWAALFAALSPALVYYSRYYIHEMLLACFTVLVLISGWRYFQSGRIGWAILLGAGIGLMYATKETFVITLGGMGLAGMILAGWSWWQAKRSSEQYRCPCRELLRTHGKAALAALIAGSIVGMVLFTSFFTNASGPLDSIRTYFPWLHRAGGHSPHIHPWYFYFERLVYYHPVRSPVWTEAIIFALALIGTIAALAGRGLKGTHPTLARFVALYSWIVALAYSVISYKTPWCLLEFWHGLILLAGLGAAVFVQWFRPRWAKAIVVLLLLAGTGQLAWQGWKATHTFAADRRNPYVYAHTAADLLQLTGKVHAISRVHPDQNQMIIKVITSESMWPLPWYLRQFKRVGYYDRLPADPYAPIMIVSARLGANLDEKSNKAWLMVGLSEIRPGVFLELYVNFELWKKYVETLPPPKDE